MLFSGCGEEEEPVEDVKIDVETVLPSVQSISMTGSFIATIEAEDKVSITPRLAGQVTSKSYKAGDQVHAGDVLFTLDDREYRIERKNAEANVRSAEAALSAQEARNAETKASATEAVATMDTKSIELYNGVMTNEREAAAAALRRDAYCRDNSIYNSEAERIKNMQKDAGNRAASARDFTNHLNSIHDAYQDIISSENPVETAKRYGVSEKSLEGETDPEVIAGIYLKEKTQYETAEQLQSAIEASKEAEKTAESEKKELDGSYAANLITKIEAEVNAQIEKGNLANAEEPKALAAKMRLDYEIFTRMTLWADAQAKVAEGDAAVVTSDTALVTAQTELETANLKIDYATVRAPIDGIITEDHIERYGTVSDQSPACVIHGQGMKKAVFYVTEDVWKNLAPGQHVGLEKDGTEYTAQIVMIGSIPDEQKKLYKVSALLENGAQDVFTAGSSVKLSAAVREAKDALTLPIGAVYYSEGKAYVFIEKDGKAVKTDIETGISDDAFIQVISGITKEDPVIVSWTSQLKDQAEVNVKSIPVIVAQDKETTGLSEKEESAVKPEEGESGEKEAQEQEITEYAETLKSVNIRKGPGTDHEKLKTASAGERYEKLAESENGWTKIRYGEGEAYINSDYIKIVGPVNSTEQIADTEGAFEIKVGPFVVYSG